MPLRTIFYLTALILGCSASIFYTPLIGVLIYIVTYNIAPTYHWWGSPLQSLEIAYGKLVAASILFGMLIHRDKLRYKKLIHKQEFLLMLFVILVWLSHFLGLPEGSLTNRNAIKMTKVLIFLLMFSHIVTDLKRYESVIWTMILVGIYLGYAAYTAPESAFFHGRLNIGVGGPDFNETNFLGAHFAMLLPFIGVMFLKGGWKSKLICILAATFIINGIVLTRSRGVFLACIVGFLATLGFTMSFMKRKRTKIIILAFIGTIGALMLTDPGFWQRMKTLREKPIETDLSAKGRILAWKAALKMVSEYPLGIGEGNFFQYVGQYDERIPGKDTHNTYFRCLAELGIQGLLVYLLLILNSFYILRGVWKQASKLPNYNDYQWHVLGLTVSLVIFFTAGLSMSHTYVEEYYWLIIFPVTLLRSVKNELIRRSMT